MKKITLIFILTCTWIIPCFSQQVFVNLDEDFPFWIDKTTTTQNGLVVFSPKANIGYLEASFRMSYWNGLFWTNLPTLEAQNVFYGQTNNLEIGEYKKNIVVAGSFYADGENIKGIAQWDGSKWSSLGGGINTSRIIHDEFSVSDFISFNDELFVCGDFMLAGGLPVKNFAKFSNDNWLDIPTALGEIKHLQSLDDALYVAGDFKIIDGVICNNIAKYSRGKWEAVANSFTSSILKLSVYGNALIVVTKDGFYSYANATWTSIGNAIQIQSIESIVEFDTRLYSTGLFIQNNTDSLRLVAITDTDMSVYLRDSEIESPISNKIMLNKWDNALYITGSFTELKKEEYDHVAMFKPGTSVVQGRVYHDKNANCVFDAGDEVKPNAIVSLNNGQSYTSTDNEGQYTLFIANNQTSTINIFPANNEIALCNGDERTVVTSGSDSVLTEDFALKLNQMSPVKLAYVGETGYQVKHGYEGSYILDCSTVDKAKYPINVKVKYDSRLTDFSASVQPQTTGNGYAEWQFNKDATVRLKFLISPYAIEMGEILEFTATATSSDKVVEEDKLNQLVVSAFDPNDKQCDKLELNTKEESLEYYVRFQNLGTDNARDIHIVDTIDSEIPIEFIQIHKNSHYEKYATSYKVRGHAIVWSFKGIELPPNATSGDEESSGFIAYQCGMAEELTVGQIFSNKAYIYFDFQPPVITNTTESVVVSNGNQIENQSDEFLVYPNPAVQVVHVQSKHLSINKVTVYSADGKQVIKAQTESELNTSVDIAHLQSGMYFLQIDHVLGSETKPIIVY
ncbi:MAG: hypothetical protein ACI8SE_000222 [Bacteroidia bacterium]|jgi:hypothetical protein